MANKLELPDAAGHLARFTRDVGVPVWPVSCATGAGLTALLQAVWDQLATQADRTA